MTFFKNHLVLLIAAVVCAIARPVVAQTPTTAPSSPSPQAILHEMKQFASTGRVLMIAAHPDDENTQLITYLSRGRCYSMAYLSVTRGDGGQNVLGPEFGDELGLIRTQELLAARRLDGGQQFFTRARDFGFSKTPVETLKIWDKQAVLGDVVRVIRTFQPDVIVTRFSPTQTNTHGHHTASAILAVAAFKLAADPKAYPEQLDTLKVWQAKRIVHNTGGPAGGGGSLPMRVDGDDPELNLSFGQIAARSRAMHKSQGFANYALNGGGGGARTETFDLLDGEPAANDIMDGVDTSWKKSGYAEKVDALIAEVIEHFDVNKPSASLDDLIKIRKIINDLPLDDIMYAKDMLLDQIIQHCVGLTVETTIASAEVTAGEEISLEHHLSISGVVPVRLDAIVTGYIPTADMKTVGTDLVAGKTLIFKTKFKVPSDRGLTQPYWLSEPASIGLYNVSLQHQGEIGRAENHPLIPIAFGFSIDNDVITVSTEPVGKADGRRIEVIAPVSLAFPFDVNLFKPSTPRTVTVELTSHRPGQNGVVKLTAPAGWKIEPAAQPFTGKAANEKQSVIFTVTPPADPSSIVLTASAEIDGKTFDTGWEKIRYPHIPPLLLQSRVELHAVNLHIATAGHEIGYLPGAGDSVADCLREMGYAVTMLTADDLEAAKLKKFDAVVVGVRAFNVRPELATKAQALFDYAAAGGTVVEQYNRPDGLKGPVVPYRLKLSGSRITDETAAMNFLAPDHPALNIPNKITPADFDGWVQERGIYFPTDWDEHWTAILGGNDPGEARLDGGLLVAECGKGHFVYTGIVFFRQLPAGVPGAYRLFANLVSLGKK